MNIKIEPQPNREVQMMKLVWEKAKTSYGFDPDHFRFDENNALIKFSEFGNQNSMFGWMIDHIRPLCKGGCDEFHNMQALHWENKITKGNSYPGKNYTTSYDFFSKKNIKL